MTTESSEEVEPVIDAEIAAIIKIDNLLRDLKSIDEDAISRVLEYFEDKYSWLSFNGRKHLCEKIDRLVSNALKTGREEEV